MELPYTYWEGEDGWLVGYLNEYPEQWTQGKDVKELEEMLLDLYENIQEEAKSERRCQSFLTHIAHFPFLIAFCSLKAVIDTRY